MNKEDLILQKLESMDAELKNVRSEMKDGFNSVDSEMKDGFNSVDSDVKGVHSEMKDGFNSVDSDVKGVHSEMKDGFNSVDSDVKGVHSEMKDGFNSVDSELKEIREDSTEMKVNQTRHGGKLETLEMKLDAFIDNMRDRKADTNERWKISGIIISCGVALVSLILSILTRLGR